MKTNLYYVNISEQKVHFSITELATSALVMLVLHSKQKKKGGRIKLLLLIVVWISLHNKMYTS